VQKNILSQIDKINLTRNKKYSRKNLLKKIFITCNDSPKFSQSISLIKIIKIAGAMFN